ncbi:MAG: AAA family ATPase [Planctomycetes bacterium]|nr:AAA family ATPase [Planctomycetota bacterium]
MSLSFFGFYIEIRLPTGVLFDSLWTLAPLPQSFFGAAMSGFIAYLEQHPNLFVALGGLAAILGAGVGCVIQYFAMRGQRDKLEVDLAECKKREGALEEKARTLEAQLSQFGEEKVRNISTIENMQIDHQTKVTQLNEEIERFQGEVETRDRAITRQKNLVNKMMQIEGQLWEKKALSGPPKFWPLQDRGMPIISVLNLKGGVGKTTVTAHLAAAFSAKGYRVLAIDLDLQGSLSGMFISASLIKQKYDDKQLLQHFLNSCTHKRKVNLLDYVHQPIFEGQQSGLVATSDKLAYAEMNLTMSWLLRIAKKDTRFLLRRALHQKRIARQYDIVLLDCPPLINTCCVNALAASDYVLVPTMPSKKSSERVPYLLEAIRRFHVHVNPHLQVAGILLNRTLRAQLTAPESTIWEQVLAQAKDRMGAPVYGFHTKIRQNPEVRQLESESTFLEPGTELFNTFRKLSEELEERMPRECRRLANSPY